MAHHFAKHKRVKGWGNGSEDRMNSAIWQFSDTLCKLHPNIPEEKIQKLIQFLPTLSNINKSITTAAKQRFLSQLLVFPILKLISSFPKNLRTSEGVEALGHFLIHLWSNSPSSGEHWRKPILDVFFSYLNFLKTTTLEDCQHNDNTAMGTDRHILLLTLHS
jgi:hypothetical protein